MGLFFSLLHHFSGVMDHLLNLIKRISMSGKSQAKHMPRTSGSVFSHLALLFLKAASAALNSACKASGLFSGFLSCPSVYSIAF